MPNFDHSISSKLPKVGTSIFTEMSALANQENALNLSQGFPDFPVDSRLIDLVSDQMKKGFNQYAPMAGLPKLRESIAIKHEKIYSVSYNPETEVTVTAGATQALYTAISAFVKEEDEVIIFTPAYDSYQPAIELNGGRPVFIQLKAPSYHIDWEEVKKVINQKTKMIIINTPHNPTGSALKSEDLLELQKLTSGTGIIVLSDEVYEHIIFDGTRHESVCHYPDLVNRSLAVYSFGKTFHATGWKMGYCIGPENLMSEFRKVHQFNVFACNHPVQAALAEYILDEDNYLQLGEFYQKKRDIFLSAIEASRFSLAPCSGTYFQLLNYEGMSDLPDTEYAIELTKTSKVASIPISVFYNTSLDNKMLRFCFAKNDETLKRAGDVICSI